MKMAAIHWTFLLLLPAALASCTVGQCTSCPSSPSTCTACASPYFLFGSSQCVSSCSNLDPTLRYYASSGQCLQCYATCEACTDGTNTGCISCRPSSNLSLLSGTCVTACPTNGYYSYNDSIVGLKCLSCASGCYSCTNSTNCTICGNNNYLLNGQCSASCPNYYFPVGSATNGRTCQSCANPYCQVCTSALTNACTQCQIGTFFQAGTCVLSCSSGYYLNGTQCVSCSVGVPGCASCINGASCSQCNSGYYYDVASTTCVPLVACDPYVQFQAVAPTITSKRVCQQCTLCPSGQYAATACALSNDAVCQPCFKVTDCMAGTYLTGVCTQSNNTACLAPAANQVPPSGFEFLTTYVQLQNVVAGTALNVSFLSSSTVTALNSISSSLGYAIIIASTDVAIYGQSSTTNVGGTLNFFFYIRVSSSLSNLSNVTNMLTQLISGPATIYRATLGNSYISATASSTPLSSTLATDAVANLSIFVNNSSTVTLSWQPPGYSSLAISAYGIYYYHVSTFTSFVLSTSATTVSANSTSLAFTGLPQGATYKFQVLAISNLGLSGNFVFGPTSTMSVTGVTPICASNCYACSLSTNCTTCLYLTDINYNGTCAPLTTTSISTITSTSTTVPTLIVLDCNGMPNLNPCLYDTCHNTGVCASGICFGGSAFSDGTGCAIGSSNGTCFSGICTLPTTTTSTTTSTTTQIVLDCTGIPTGNTCLTDTCHAAGVCSSGVCYSGQALADGTSCTDGQNAGECYTGVCQPITTTTPTPTETTTTTSIVSSCIGLPTGNPCVFDSCHEIGVCSSGVCYAGPNLVDGTSCSTSQFVGLCYVGVCQQITTTTKTTTTKTTKTTTKATTKTTTTRCVKRIFNLVMVYKLHITT